MRAPALRSTCAQHNQSTIHAVLHRCFTGWACGRLLYRLRSRRPRFAGCRHGSLIPCLRNCAKPLSAASSHGLGHESAMRVRSRARSTRRHRAVSAVPLVLHARAVRTRRARIASAAPCSPTCHADNSRGVVIRKGERRGRPEGDHKKTPSTFFSPVYRIFALLSPASRSSPLWVLLSLYTTHK